MLNLKNAFLPSITFKDEFLISNWYRKTVAAPAMHESYADLQLIFAALGPFMIVVEAKLYVFIWRKSVKKTKKNICFSVIVNHFEKSGPSWKLHLQNSFLLLRKVYLNFQSKVIKEKTFASPASHEYVDKINCFLFNYTGTSDSK